MAAACPLPLCWHAQVATGIFGWTTRSPTSVGVLLTVLPRYQEAHEVRNRCATCALPVRSGRSTCAPCQVATDSSRTSSWWTLDWPVGSSNHTPSFREDIAPLLVRCTTLILLVHIPLACTPAHTDSQGSLCVTSSSVFTVPSQWFWGYYPGDGPAVGAVCFHMSRTPNSDVSGLWSPGDDSEDFAPSPAQAAPAPGTSAVGTPVGGLLSRVLRRGNYAPESRRSSMWSSAEVGHTHSSCT